MGQVETNTFEDNPFIQINLILYTRQDDLSPLDYTLRENIIGNYLPIEGG